MWRKLSNQLPLTWLGKSANAHPDANALSNQSKDLSDTQMLNNMDKSEVNMHNSTDEQDFKPYEERSCKEAKTLQTQMRAQKSVEKLISTLDRHLRNSRQPDKEYVSPFALPNVHRTQPTNVTSAPRVEQPTSYTFAYTREIGSDGGADVDYATADRVVECAVQIALDRQRYPTAYALRTLYDEKRSDHKTVRLFEALYSTRATVEQVSEFTRLLKEKKKEGKKDRVGECYFYGDEGAAERPNKPKKEDGFTTL
ncbi:hypothetical protein G7Y89_g1163 [Cudoniella acicularis]|uniref:Uncharacterized protein n=1 Tax=Cudoniella acicularis TaxID=354080 RepID=A0A8H4RVU3_9HELO|nr:hypothetical protein G7Y89_g1163 [Cudoniella acicularis]